MTDETTQALLPVKVTQADRDLIVTLMRPLAKSAIEHKAIDFIAEGRGDDAEAVQLVAKYRLAHSPPSQADATSGEEMRLREALEAITFLTCVSGNGPTPYLKVHFNDLAAAHAGHDALLAMKRGRP